MLIPHRKFKNPRSGFTLVELLVTISIFVILTGVILFNQANFNSTILLTNLAYDTALTLRQAQTYGINIKEFSGSLGTRPTNFLPYGVHFDITSPKSFILFADTDYVDINDKGEGLYVPLLKPNHDLSTCYPDDSCVNRYNIQRGSYIHSLCLDADGSGPCTGTNSVDSLDIVFQRPSPEAHIKSYKNSSYSSVTSAVRIVLANSAGDSFREVVVQPNGLIYIKPR